MAYFLGRDVAIGLTTEQPHYALELDSGDLKIAGHADNAYDADKVFVARRKDVGNLAEVSKISIIGSASASDFESTAANNKYILVYNSAGKKYLIWFDEGTDDAVKPAGVDEDFDVEVTMSGANNVAMATTLRAALSGNTTFAAAFTVSDAASGSDNNVIFTDKVSGTAADIVRGSGFTASIVTVSTNTDGTVSALADLPKVKMTDITGVDFTFGAVDEDINYFGQRTALKAEIKNEVTLSITKKKKDAGFSQLFNEARCGIRATSILTSEQAEGLAESGVEMDNNLNRPFADVNGSGFGYRLYLQLMAGTEVMTLRNMCITEYSITLNADAVQEETIVFYGNVKPLIGTVLDDDVTTEADF